MQSWTEHQIKAAKEEIRTSLLPLNPEPTKRLQKIMSWLTSLQGSLAPKDQLYRVVLIISALVHHRRQGGLTASTIQKLTKLAHAILQTQGIKPNRSVGCNLYHDMHLVLGQIRRNNGDHRAALWDQLLAEHQSQMHDEESRGFHLVTLAQRSQRLGQLHQTEAYLRQAENGGLHRYDRDTLLVTRTRTLRLMGDTRGAQQHIESVLRFEEIHSETRLELEWESLLLELMKSQDLRPLCERTRKDGSHYSESYILETYLWCFALPTTKYETFLVKLSTLSRRKELNFPATGYLYKAVSSLIEFQDIEVPINLRLKHLGDALNESRLLGSIDKELLFWAAAARVLSRHRASEFANFALSEYLALSQTCSQGANRDVLGVVGDLYLRGWFQSSQVVNRVI